jgi:hypothetical protein
MRNAGWETAKSGLSVIVAIPGVSPLLGLVGTVLGAVTGGHQPQTSRKFAYPASLIAEASSGLAQSGVTPNSHISTIFPFLR